MAVGQGVETARVNDRSHEKEGTENAAQ
jgi:hypothetical protein